MQEGWGYTSLKEFRFASHAPRLQCHKLFHFSPSPAPPPFPSPFPPRYAEACAFFDAMAAGKVRAAMQAEPQGEGEVGGAEEGGEVGEGAGLVVCSTALNLARSLGCYVHLLGVLPGGEGVRAMVGLFELYLFVVFSTFWCGPPLGTPAIDEGGLPPKVRAMLARVYASMQTQACEQQRATRTHDLRIHYLKYCMYTALHVGPHGSYTQCKYTQTTQLDHTLHVHRTKCVTRRTCLDVHTTCSPSTLRVDAVKSGHPWKNRRGVE